MKLRELHRWDVTPKEAVRLQEELRSQVNLKRTFGKVRYIAGADVATDKGGEKGFAGVILYRMPEMTEVERRQASTAVTFPYVPGLLAFREAPVLLKAFTRLGQEPDVILIDGQGIAHPRRMGIACHIGLLLDVPTIGCAKSRLIGEFEEPGSKSGDHTPLADSGEIIGAVLRTRDNVRPVFVSPGHKIDVAASVAIVMSCADSYRIPKPTREADHLVRAIERDAYLRSLASGS